MEPGESLLLRRFYVSPELGRERLLEIVGREIATRPNCVRSSESTPPPAMLQEAARIRKEQGLTEPMFRTLLRFVEAGQRARAVRGPEAFGLSCCFEDRQPILVSERGSDDPDEC